MQSEAQAKKNIIVFIGLFLFSLVLFLGDKKSFILPIKSIFQKPFILFSSPFFHFSRTTTSFYDFAIVWPEREKEYQIMQNQLNKIEIEKNQLNICLDENEKIKKLLGAGLPAQWKFMDCRVIGFGDNLRIDKGQSDGLEIGMNVVSESMLVGKITKVNQHDSLVELIDQPSQKIPVQVKPYEAKVTQGQADRAETKAKGLLVGLGKNRLEINHVLQEEKLDKDDFVLTLGQEGWLPNLIIGRIDVVDEDKSSIYQQASVLPLIDFRKLEMVFVVIKY